jgi:transposase
MQGHLSQHNHDAAPAFAGQPLPNRRRQIAHREIQANAPTRTALGTRFSAIRRAPSNYERQCQWDIERMFRRLKDFRRIATRYDRNAVNFLAAVCIAATVSYWL